MNISERRSLDVFEISFRNVSSLFRIGQNIVKQKKIEKKTTLEGV